MAVSNMMAETPSTTLPEFEVFWMNPTLAQTTDDLEQQSQSSISSHSSLANEVDDSDDGSDHADGQEGTDLGSKPLLDRSLVDDYSTLPLTPNASESRNLFTKEFDGTSRDHVDCLCESALGTKAVAAPPVPLDETDSPSHTPQTAMITPPSQSLVSQLVGGVQKKKFARRTRLREPSPCEESNRLLCHSIVEGQVAPSRTVKPFIETEVSALPHDDKSVIKVPMVVKSESSKQVFHNSPKQRSPHPSSARPLLLQWLGFAPQVASEEASDDSSNDSSSLILPQSNTFTTNTTTSTASASRENVDCPNDATMDGNDFRDSFLGLPEEEVFNLSIDSYYFLEQSSMGPQGIANSVNTEWNGRPDSLGIMEEGHFNPDATNLMATQYCSVDNTITLLSEETETTSSKRESESQNEISHPLSEVTNGSAKEVLPIATTSACSLANDKPTPNDAISSMANGIIKSSILSLTEQEVFFLPLPRLSVFKDAKQANEKKAQEVVSKQTSETSSVGSTGSMKPKDLPTGCNSRGKLATDVLYLPIENDETCHRRSEETAVAFPIESHIYRNKGNDRGYPVRAEASASFEPHHTIPSPTSPGSIEYRPTTEKLRVVSQEINILASGGLSSVKKSEEKLVGCNCVNAEKIAVSEPVKHGIALDVHEVGKQTRLDKEIEVNVSIERTRDVSKRKEKCDGAAPIHQEEPGDHCSIQESLYTMSLSTSSGVATAPVTLSEVEVFALPYQLQVKNASSLVVPPPIPTTLTCFSGKGSLENEIRSSVAFDLHHEPALVENTRSDSLNGTHADCCLALEKESETDAFQAIDNNCNQGIDDPKEPSREKSTWPFSLFTMLPLVSKSDRKDGEIQKSTTDSSLKGHESVKPTEAPPMPPSRNNALPMGVSQGSSEMYHGEEGDLSSDSDMNRNANCSQEAKYPKQEQRGPSSGPQTVAKSALDGVDANYTFNVAEYQEGDADTLGLQNTSAQVPLNASRVSTTATVGSCSIFECGNMADLSGSASVSAGIDVLESEDCQINVEELRQSPRAPPVKKTGGDNGTPCLVTGNKNQKSSLETDLNEFNNTMEEIVLIVSKLRAWATRKGQPDAGKESATTGLECDNFLMKQLEFLASSLEEQFHLFGSNVALFECILKGLTESSERLQIENKRLESRLDEANRDRDNLECHLKESVSKFLLFRKESEAEWIESKEEMKQMFKQESEILKNQMIDMASQKAFVEKELKETSSRLALLQENLGRRKNVGTQTYSKLENSEENMAMPFLDDINRQVQVITQKSKHEHSDSEGQRGNPMDESDIVVFEKKGPVIQITDGVSEKADLERHLRETTSKLLSFKQETETRWLEYREEVKSLYMEEKECLKRRVGELMARKGEVENKLHETMVKMSKLEKEGKEKERALEAVKSSQIRKLEKDLKQSLVENEEWKRFHEQSKSQIAEIEGKWEAAQRDLQRLRMENQALHVRIEEEVSQKAGIERHLQETSSKLIQFKLETETKFADYREKFNSMYLEEKKGIEEMMLKKAAVEKQLERTSSKLRELEERSQEQKKLLLRRSGSLLQRFAREISRVKVEKEQLKLQVEDLEFTVCKAETAVEELDLDKQTLRVQNSELQALLSDFRSTLSLAEELIEGSELESQDLELHLESAQSQISRFENHLDLQVSMGKAKSRGLSAEQTPSSCEDIMSVTSESDVWVQQIRSERDCIQEQLKAAQSQIVMLEGRLSNYADGANAARKAKEAADIRTRELESDNSELEVQLKNLLDDLSFLNDALSISKAECEILQEEKEKLEKDLSFSKQTILSSFEQKVASQELVSELEKALYVAESSLKESEARGRSLEGQLRSSSDEIKLLQGQLAAADSRCKDAESLSLIAKGEVSSVRDEMKGIENKLADAVAEANILRRWKEASVFLLSEFRTPRHIASETLHETRAQSVALGKEANSLHDESKALDKACKDYKCGKSQLETGNLELEEFIKKTESKRKAIDSCIDSFQEEKNSLRTENKNQSQRLRDCQLEKDNLTAKLRKSEAERIKLELKMHLEKKYSQASIEVDRARMQEIEVRMASLQDQLQESFIRVSALQEEQIVEKSLRIEAERQFVQLEAKSEDRSRERESAMVQINELKVNLSSIKESSAETEKALEQSKSLSEQLRSELNDSNKNCMKLRLEKDAVDAQVHEMQLQVDAIEEELRGKRLVEEELAKIKPQLCEVMAQKRELEGQILEKNEKLFSIKVEYDAVVARFDDYTKEAEKNKDIRIEVENQLTEAISRLATLEDRHATTITELQELQTYSKNVQMHKDEIESEFAVTSLKLKALENENALLNDRIKEYEIQLEKMAGKVTSVETENKLLLARLKDLKMQSENVNMQRAEAIAKLKAIENELETKKAQGRHFEVRNAKGEALINELKVQFEKAVSKLVTIEDRDADLIRQLQNLRNEKGKVDEGLSRKRADLCLLEETLCSSVSNAERLEALNVDLDCKREAIAENLRNVYAELESHEKQRLSTKAQVKETTVRNVQAEMQLKEEDNTPANAEKADQTGQEHYIKKLEKEIDLLRADRDEIRAGKEIPDPRSKIMERQLKAATFKIDDLESRLYDVNVEANVLRVEKELLTARLEQAELQKSAAQNEFRQEIASPRFCKQAKSRFAQANHFQDSYQLFSDLNMGDFSTRGSDELGHSLSASSDSLSKARASRNLAELNLQNSLNAAIGKVQTLGFEKRRLEGCLSAEKTRNATLLSHLGDSCTLTNALQSERKVIEAATACAGSNGSVEGNEAVSLIGLTQEQEESVVRVVENQVPSVAQEQEKQQDHRVLNHLSNITPKAKQPTANDELESSLVDLARSAEKKPANISMHDREHNSTKQQTNDEALQDNDKNNTNRQSCAGLTGDSELEVDGYKPMASVLPENRAHAAAPSNLSAGDNEGAIKAHRRKRKVDRLRNEVKNSRTRLFGMLKHVVGERVYKAGPKNSAM